MDTTHAAICGCTNPDCAWKDGRTWDVVRLDETLERVIIRRNLNPDEAFFDAQLLNDSLNPSAPIVYIVCAPEGVISFEDEDEEEDIDLELKLHNLDSAWQVVRDFIKQMEWTTMVGNEDFELAQVKRIVNPSEELALAIRTIEEVA